MIDEENNERDENNSEKSIEILDEYKINPENDPTSKEFIDKYGITYELFEERDQSLPSPELSIVIPAHNEGEEILGLLESLSKQIIENSNNAEVVVVINNDNEKEKNTMDSIERAISENKIDKSIIRIIKCNYPYISDKTIDGIPIGGVGLARKIGMDSAIKSGAKSVASMDADWEIQSEFISSIESKMNTGIDGFSFENFGIISDESRPYLEYKKLLETFRSLYAINEPTIENDSKNALDKNTGAVHVVGASAYCKAGGMVPKITGEDGSFGIKLIESDAKIRKSEVKVGVKIRESDTPGGQGEDMKLFNIGQVENPNNPNEHISIQEAIKIINEDKEYQKMLSTEKLVESTISKLESDLKKFYLICKQILTGSMSSEDMAMVKTESNKSEYINKFINSINNSDVILYQALFYSENEDVFVDKLESSIGEQVYNIIKDSII